MLASAVLLCLASLPSFDAASRVPPRTSQAAAVLREAREAREAGKLGRAAGLLEQVARDHPIIADHAGSLRAEILTEKGEPAEAVAVLLEAIAAHPDSSLRGAMFGALGSARLEFDDEGGARAAWSAALRERDRELAPELMLALARSYEREGKPEDAFERYRELWLSVPTSDEAGPAAERLDALEAQRSEQTDSENPPRLRKPEDWRKRGDRLFRARHNQQALASFDKALELGLSQGSARRAAYQRAHTLFRMRRYPQAVEAFAGLPEDAEQRLWLARSLARSGRVPEAIEAFQALESEGHGSIGLRASYFAGLLLDGRDRHDEARTHFERVAASRRQHGLADGALWRLAWREYQDGDCDAALPRLERLIEIEDDPITELRPRYWRARCLEALGRPEAAHSFAELASGWPFTYYGWRASFRAPRGPAAAEPEVRALEPGRRGLAERDLARARILIAAGYSELARRELGGLRSSVRGLAERIELARLLSDAGDFHAAQRVVVDAYLGDLARGPSARREELWWHAWPAAFGPEVSRATADPRAAERELVYAIMREESGYRPEVLSVSGAYGLMQIMPTTGERLAKDLGRSAFVRDDLLQPSVNVALGAFYLGQLAARFPERLSAAIASYNAGPKAVASWLVDDPAKLDDEWVEAIPYDQTRGYVRRVLRSLHVYRVLY